MQVGDAITQIDGEALSMEPTEIGKLTADPDRKPDPKEISHYIEAKREQTLQEAQAAACASKGKAITRELAKNLSPTELTMAVRKHEAACEATLNKLERNVGKEEIAAFAEQVKVVVAKHFGKGLPVADVAESTEAAAEFAQDIAANAARAAASLRDFKVPAAIAYPAPEVAFFFLTYMGIAQSSLTAIFSCGPFFVKVIAGVVLLALLATIYEIYCTVTGSGHHAAYHPIDDNGGAAGAGDGSIGMAEETEMKDNPMMEERKSDGKVGRPVVHSRLSLALTPGANPDEDALGKKLPEVSFSVHSPLGLSTAV